jgi:predicted O-methyltransferase YrrM
MNIDAKILALINELDELRMKRDDHWQIPREEGQLLFQFAVATGAKRVLELGTSYGFSGLFWGAAVQRAGGTLHTVDNDPKKYESSMETFRRAGLGRTVVNRLGDAAEWAGRIEGPFDIAFLDASDKALARNYFDIVWPKVRVGGSVFTDNATTHRSELADFMSYVRSRADASSSEVPVGNGVEWTLKLR